MRGLQVVLQPRPLTSSDTPCFLPTQVDPTLSRTVLVSTKFDTRIPTFSRAADVEMFLKPSGLEGGMLGGAPFFTWVAGIQGCRAAEAWVNRCAAWGWNAACWMATPCLFMWVAWVAQSRA